MEGGAVGLASFHKTTCEVVHPDMLYRHRGGYGDLSVGRVGTQQDTVVGSDVIDRHNAAATQIEVFPLFAEKCGVAVVEHIGIEGLKIAHMVVTLRLHADVVYPGAVESRDGERGLETGHHSEAVARHAHRTVCHHPGGMASVGVPGHGDLVTLAMLHM